MTSGWVLRKVKQNDKWVRRWLEVNRHVLYSYQACPAESAQARVINMLDLRKTREIKLVDNGIAGLFCIVPVSADNAHPGYLMRADTATSAEEWVAGLNKVRQQELEKVRRPRPRLSSRAVAPAAAPPPRTRPRARAAPEAPSRFEFRRVPRRARSRRRAARPRRRSAAASRDRENRRRRRPSSKAERPALSEGDRSAMAGGRFGRPARRSTRGPLPPL